MADSPDTSVPDHVQRPSEDHSTELMIAKTRRSYKDSIQRLEHLIFVQELRVKNLRHPSRQLLASMKDMLLTYKLTLQQVRQSAENLEISWALME